MLTMVPQRLYGEKHVHPHRPTMAQLGKHHPKHLTNVYAAFANDFFVFSSLTVSLDRRIKFDISMLQLIGLTVESMTGKQEFCSSTFWGIQFNTLFLAWTADMASAALSW